MCYEPETYVHNNIYDKTYYWEYFMSLVINISAVSIQNPSQCKWWSKCASLCWLHFISTFKFLDKFPGGRWLKLQHLCGPIQDGYLDHSLWLLAEFYLSCSQVNETSFYWVLLIVVDEHIWSSYNLQKCNKQFRCCLVQIVHTDALVLARNHW